MPIWGFYYLFIHCFKCYFSQKYIKSVFIFTKVHAISVFMILLSVQNKAKLIMHRILCVIMLIVKITVFIDLFLDSKNVNCRLQSMSFSAFKIFPFFMFLYIVIVHEILCYRCQVSLLHVDADGYWEPAQVNHLLYFCLKIKNATYQIVDDHKKLF